LWQLALLEPADQHGPKAAGANRERVREQHAGRAVDRAVGRTRRAGPSAT
jgi:hypothetical protein